MEPPFNAPRSEREPAINLPLGVTIFFLVLLSIHALREFLLDRDGILTLILLLSFIPARYDGAEIPFAVAAWWSPFSYSLLHGDWMHLAVNSVWLAAFGSPVFSRLGATRAIGLALAASAGGAAAHFVSHMGEAVPLVGASAVVAGYMGAAARFAFRPGHAGGLAVHGPALPLRDSFSDQRFLGFVAVWLVLNFVFGSGVTLITGESTNIAWQAHVGGFAVGVLGFSLFDRNPGLANPRSR